jgi:hypothetical protein
VAAAPWLPILGRSLRAYGQAKLCHSDAPETPGVIDRHTIPQQRWIESYLAL